MSKIPGGTESVRPLRSFSTISAGDAQPLAARVVGLAN